MIDWGEDGSGKKYPMCPKCGALLARTYGGYYCEDCEAAHRIKRAALSSAEIEFYEAMIEQYKENVAYARLIGFPVELLAPPPKLK
jgi:ribosomal protein S27AE